MKNPRRIALVIGGAAVLAACGGEHAGHTATGSSGSGPSRTIDVRMVDIDFRPSALQVKQGETVRFVFTNSGKVAHDAFIGDATAQAEHEMQLRAATSDTTGHGAHGGDGITVQPGSTGELAYTFAKAGRLEVGCHEVGHYDAGMKIAVDVT